MSARASKSQVASAVSTYYLCQQLGMMGGAFLGAAVKGGILGGMLWRKLSGSHDGVWLEKVSTRYSVYIRVLLRWWVILKCD